jgi:hypothetical protein
MTIWYILCSFDNFFLFLVSCPKKNLATLLAIFLQLLLRHSMRSSVDTEAISA